VVKWIIVGVIGGAGVVAGLGAVALGLLGGLPGAFDREPEPEGVIVERVERRALTRLVSAPGEVEPRRDVQISAQVQARIEALPFEEGDLVDAGDVVVELDDEDLQAALESAQANLKIQEARLEQARVALDSSGSVVQSERARVAGVEAQVRESRSELERVRSLYESADVPLSELERAESAYDQAEASLGQARAAVEQAEQGIRRAQAELLAAEGSVESARQTIRQRRKDLDNATIRAPISGVITAVHAEVGELVVIGTLNNAASVILEIADLGEMLLMARVDEANVALVDGDQRALVYVNAYPDDPFQGVVERVGLTKLRWTDGTEYFETEVRIELDDRRRLRAGLSATCDIEVETVEDALRVPSQAVLSRRIDELPAEVRDASVILDLSKTFANVVYTVRDGRAAVVPVRVGISDLSHTVIEAGLDEGQRIVTGPFRVLRELADEDPVEIEGEPSPTVDTAESPGARAKAEGGSA